MSAQSTKTLKTDLRMELKPLSKAGVAAALEKAEHYRLLNHPRLAESICLDILAVERDNANASIILLLSLTDQFGKHSSRASKQAHMLAQNLEDDYSRNYYSGIVYERQAANALSSGIPGAEFDAYEWYLEAMNCFQQAEAIHPFGNDDAVLRWNTCVRTVTQYNLQERPLDDRETQLE